MKNYIILLLIIIPWAAFSQEKLTPIKPQGDEKKIAEAKVIIKNKIRDTGMGVSILSLKELSPKGKSSLFPENEIVSVDCVTIHAESGHGASVVFLIGLGDKPWVLSRTVYPDEFFLLLKKKDKKVSGLEDVKKYFASFSSLMNLQGDYNNMNISQKGEGFLVKIPISKGEKYLKYELSLDGDKIAACKLKTK